MKKLWRGVLVLFFLFLLFGGLYFAKEFLAPVVLAGVLAMLFIGLSNYLEGKGIKRAFSAFISVFVLVALVASIFYVLSIQLKEFAGDVSVMKQRVASLAEDIKGWISETLGISEAQQDKIIEQQSQDGGSSAGTVAATVLNTVSSLAVNMVLGLVYMYLLLFYRSHIKKFILKLVPDSELKNTDTIIHQSVKVAQKYLGGLSMMIMMLWVMYGIGFSIVGVKNAIFFAVLCGLLEIVPFVGNVTGTTITVLAVLIQGGDQGMVVGVIATYFTIQFVQTYILEPLVVGEQVSINPLFTIMALVVGELVWGIPGMVLAIPLLGIVKIICDNVPDLKPYGFLIGSGENKKKEGIGSWFKRVILRRKE
jgi:predicted PurR-regulated permease PerM